MDIWINNFIMKNYWKNLHIYDDITIKKFINISEINIEVSYNYLLSFTFFDGFFRIFIPHGILEDFRRFENVTIYDLQKYESSTILKNEYFNCHIYINFKDINNIYFSIDNLTLTYKNYYIPEFIYTKLKNKIEEAIKNEISFLSS